jgi:peptide/nickel transport system substrate-binding protein
MGRAHAAALAVALLLVPAAGGWAAETPRRGGTLYIPRFASSLPACLNPFACERVQPDPLLTQVLEGAFETGPDLVQRPNLVSRAEYTKKPFTVTYHIRPEARWSDGVAITAHDFEFSYEQYRTIEPPGLDWVGLYRKIWRTSVLGPKTYRVEFREPYAYWRELFPIVLPKHVLEGHDLTKRELWLDRIDDPATGRPIGSGPFLIRSFERGRQLILVRNPRYWGPHTAFLDRIVYRFEGVDTPQDPLGPVQRNEFDLSFSAGGAVLSADTAAQVRRLSGWSVRAWPAPTLEHLTFRVRPPGHPALQNPLVRRALAFGIDRAEIARVMLADAPRRDRRPLDSTVFLPSERDYRPNWSRYRYDPMRARRLLEQAGCSMGSDDVYVCDGQPLRLRFVTTAGSPERATILQLIETQLRRAGVEVVRSFVPATPLFGDVLPAGQYDAALFAWVTNGGGRAWDEADCWHVQNWSGYCTRLVAREYQQLKLVLDSKARASVLHALDAKLARAVPVLPLVQSASRVAFRSHVRGLVTHGGSFNVHFAQNSEDWWLAR